jgi:hypothetical protein
MAESGTCPILLEEQMLKTVMCATLSAAALIVAVPLSTQAAAPGFCRDYAGAAVRQVEVARSIPACNRGAGARWTTDYKVPFDWRLGAAPDAVEGERMARSNWIRSCRGF